MNIINSISRITKKITSNITNVISGIWNSLGLALDGSTYTGGLFGRSLALNASGDKLVVGYPNADLNGADSGGVAVFSWDGSTWNQLGTQISGPFSTDYAGSSVSINASGDRIAIGLPGSDTNGLSAGTVRVYSYSSGSGSWIQLGSDMNGTAGTTLGSSISMNAAGDVIIIGCPYADSNGITDSGQIAVYRYTGSSWTGKGSGIEGSSASDRFGWSVSISDDGNIIAIGSPYVTVLGGNETGTVKIYSFNSGTNQWVQLGSTINGTGGDNFGYSIALNSAGDRIVVGGQSYSSAGKLQNGVVRVYSYSGGSWIQLGSDIIGDVNYDHLGKSVSINSSGDRITVGIPDFDSPSSTGIVRTFYWNGSSWIQFGSDIVGVGGYAGVANYNSTLSMNNTGDIIAMGAPLYGGGQYGLVKIYKLT